MKHTSLILFAALAIVAAACSDGDPMPNPADSGIPIAFDETSGAGVRAVEIAEIADGTAFGVTGYYDIGGELQSGDAVFDNVEVTRSGADCTYAPLRYWSLDETMKIRFFAWYPYRAEGLTVGTAYPRPLTYTVRNDIAQQLDLLCYAAKEPVHLTDLDASGGKVPLKFQHALTRLHFAVRLADDVPQGYRIKVKRIALTAFPTGTMTFNATAAPAEDAVSDDGIGISWALPPEAERIYATYLLTSEAGLTDTEFSKTNAAGTPDDATDVTAAGYRMCLIPQRMTGKITVDYELANGPDPAAEGYRYIVNDGVELTLADTGSTLKPGTDVTYTLTIGKYRASVVLNVSDWEDGNSGDTDLEFN